ncbi:MAG TPA: zf-HC2 domain-containing protein [Actinomycetota bacterium]|jgi:anti-sigma factor RsiW
MRHDPERDAAVYVGGVLSRRRARRFEAHLLQCEDCWAEVAQARRGRSLAEQVRELAPQPLRELVRASVAGALTHTGGRRRRGLVAGAVAFVVLTAATVALVARPGLRTAGRQPEPIAQAIADFRSGRLPAARAPARQAPDLSSAGFELVGSGGGEVGAVAVDAFRYRDASGRRVQLYLSARPFPVALGAHRSDRPDGPWTAGGEGVALLCAQHPLPLLALSTDERVLRDIASSLRIR